MRCLWRGINNAQPPKYLQVQIVRENIFRFSILSGFRSCASKIRGNALRRSSVLLMTPFHAFINGVLFFGLPSGILLTLLWKFWRE